jgi:hypothetical protein
MTLTPESGIAIGHIFDLTATRAVIVVTRVTGYYRAPGWTESSCLLESAEDTGRDPRL